ncbi:tripartite tricarboxylate transporter substrate binding protein [Salicibibacter cibi]|uniref:Tripartite tricarboxylate transporter substrate binding protein n=1 Tax=Salicibibacter cibi TaxID=2743001 RepID=A0A7T7CGZ5_9BACI|nr:tripartite tricarboxylate transporter substrate-binding protein [Salicibibacter cibi]QQK81723.1 tripartite tricarboxylate transporter substrate binding protein [Salicibibacter cibi]
MKKLLPFLILGLFLSACNETDSTTSQEEERWEPEANVELVAPARAGGGWDTSARMIADVIMEQNLMDQDIGVVNKPGGTGAVGWAYIENVQDPQNIFTTSTTMVFSMLAGNSDYNWDDMTPIANLAADYGIIAVREDAPWDTLTELMEDYKENPEDITVTGGNTPGGFDHVQFIDLAQEAGIPMEDISYVADQSSGGIPNLLSGNVDVLTSKLGSGVIEQHRAGDIRILAVLSEDRLEAEDVSDFPTAVEQGYDTVFINWRGVYGPSSLTDAQVEYYEDIMRQVSESDQFADIRDQFGWEEMFMGSEEYTEFIREEVEENRVIMDELGLLDE